MLSRFGLEARNFLAIKIDVLFLEGVLKEQFLEEVGVGDDRVVLQVLGHLLGGLLGELLRHLLVDDAHGLVAEAGPGVVAVGTQHLGVARTAVEVLGDCQRRFVLRLDLDGLLEDILTKVLPGQSQRCSPHVVPLLGFTSVQIHLSLHIPRLFLINQIHLFISIFNLINSYHRLYHPFHKILQQIHIPQKHNYPILFISQYILKLKLTNNFQLYYNNIYKIPLIIYCNHKIFQKMQEEYVALKWGDIVRIHGVNLSKKKDTKGLIISKGFTDTNIYYQIYNQFSDVNFYRESLFQVLPRVNFDMHDQLLEENITEELRENLKSRANGEIAALENSLVSKAGKQVKYGSEIIFRHIQSKSYVYGMLQAANSGEGAFRIEVSENLSSYVIFKLVSPRSFQNQNDVVYYNDALRIYHPYSDSYMNFSQTEQPIYLDIPQQLQPIPNDHPCKQITSHRPSIKKPNSKRTFIMNQNKSKCLWKFIEHCSYQQFINKQKIKSHDIVYFKHTKKGEESLVSTSISIPDNCFLKQNKQGNISYQCFWELIPSQVNQNGPEDCNVFQARNIVTGQLLQYNKFNVQVATSGQSSGKGFDNRGLINLICSATDQCRKLELGTQMVDQSHNLSKIQEYYEQQSKKYQLTAVKILPKDIFMIYKVDQELLLNAMYVISAHQSLIKFVEKFSSGVLALQKDVDPENYPKLFAKFTEEQLNNIVKIQKMLTSKIYGTDYQNIQASGNTPNQAVQQILVQSGIAQILIEILYNLYNPFRFIEKNNQPSEDRAIRLKIADIFQYTYRLLEKIATNFQENRIYISRWIDLFLEHSNNVNKSYIQECILGILSDNPLAIRATINQTKIKNLIENFLKEAEQSKNTVLTTKYLRLFSTFIVCEHSVIKQNQNIILEHFFKNPKNQYNFRFKVDEKFQGAIEQELDPYKVKSKQVMISLGKLPFITLTKFFQKHKNKWNYLMAYINLLADVCKDRNNSAIDSVSSILSLQAVATTLFSSQVEQLCTRIRDENSKSTLEKPFPVQNIHEPFIRIAHHVYVDNNKFQEIKRIKRISQWYQHQDDNWNGGYQDINKTKRSFEGEKQQQEKNYLQSILEYIKNYIKNCNQDVSNLNMLNKVLNLLKSTVILGLWKSIKSFREIAPDLLLKITKIENSFFFQKSAKPKTASDLVNLNKNKLKMSRPEIALGIQCKIGAIQIFRYMYDLEVDIRLRYMMNFFKGLYKCTQNFNLYDKPYQDQLTSQAGEDEAKRNETAKGEYYKMEGKALLGDTVKKMSEDVDIILKENVWLNKLNQLTPFKYEKQIDPMKDRYMFQTELGEQQLEKYVEDLQKQFNTIVLGLFELSVYEDYRILNSSLKMLRTMFQQRKDLIQNFKKMLICGKGNLQEVYLTLKFMREKFNMLANSSIKKYQGDADKLFPYQIKKPYDYLIKDREKRSGIVEDLFFLARTLKDGTSLKNIQSLMWVDEDFFTNQVYNFINQKQKNNPLFQSLNLAEGIYKPLFDYIKIMDGSQKIDRNHRKLLLSIYQYLTLLCFNNLEAKQILMHYIPYILPHLKQKVGAASFLYEVTRNNKLLVSNQELVSLIIQSAVDSCSKLQQNYAIADFVLKMILPQANNYEEISNDYQRSRILFSLRGILLFNNQGVKKNQQLLMNKLQNDKYNRLIFQGTIQSNPNSSLNDFNLTGPETYIVYAFELFSVLVQSGNMINIGKLENLHDYQYCLQCLSASNKWEIRRSLRAYINRLYYVNKDKDIFLFEKFIGKEFNILNKELGDLIQLHRNKLLSQDLKIKNGIRFSFAQSQIFLFIIECLITLHEMFLKPDFLKILRRQLAKDKGPGDTFPLHDSFIKLFKNLGCLYRIYSQVKTIGPFINEVKNLMMVELERFPLKYLEKKSEPSAAENRTNTQVQDPVNKNASTQTEKKGYMYDHSKSFFKNLSIMMKFYKEKQHLDNLKQEHQKSKKQVNVPQNQLKKKYLTTIFSVPNEKKLSLRPYYTKVPQKKVLHYDPHLQTANSRIFKVLAKPELEQDEQNIQLNNNLNLVKTMIEDSPIFDKFKDDQFIFFVNTTTAIDSTSNQQYDGNWRQQKQQPKPVISLKQIFTKIFKLIRQNPDKIDDQQKIFVIKLVRCYITQSVQGKQSYKLPVDKWDAQYCQSNDILTQRQKQIQACGGSDFIISIFTENLTGRVQLLNQALLLGIAYLFGGNHTCQNSIADSLKKDQENVMMINIKNLIKNIGDFLMNVRKIKENQKKRTFAYNIVDTYDYFNPQDKMISKYFSQTKYDKFQVQTQLDNEKALCRIFRFLQLFCQNNNKDMKKFLSTQINQDGNKKTNTINFVEQASILLKKLFKVMNSKLVMIPNNLLAFVGQVTQVPILDNQISFMKSTFFEDISYMASFFNSPENKLHRKFNLVAEGSDDPLNALSQIYRQAIALALGNFEGNQQIIIKQFLNKCQSKLLWLIIRDEIWELIKTKYSKFDFFVQDQKDDQSRRKTFKKLDEYALQKIIIEERKQMNFQGPIISIIQVLIILRKIQDYAQVKQKSALADQENPNLKDAEDGKRARDFKQQIIQIANSEEESFPHMKKLLVLFNELILQIQINCQNGVSQKLQYIYFPGHPVFSYLADTTRDKIMVQVKRDTSRDKLTDLLNFRQEVYDEIQWNYKLNFYKIGNRDLSITSELCEKIRSFAVKCSYLVIFLMFFTIVAEHEIDDEQPTTYFTFESKLENILLKFVCGIQLLLMLLYSVLWYILRGQLAFKKYLKNLESEGEEAEEPSEQQPAQEPDLGSGFRLEIARAIFYKLYKSIRDFAWRYEFLAKIMTSFIEFYKKIYHNVYLRILALMTESEFKSILFFLLTSFLGNFSRVEWYTTHLFNFFVGVPQLINVFKAIIQNIQPLLILSVLAIAFTAVFNTLSLSTYVPVIYQDQLPAQSCESILGCILVVYTSGAIGDDMQMFEFGRFFFDLIYVVFMELLFQNLVGGIMIDAYGGLIDADKTREEDKKGKCYICSMSKSNIQKLGQTFKKHTDKHFLWNYLYYIYCLQKKDETDYTGIQYIIKNKIDREEITWFPQEGEEDSGGQIEGLLNQLSDKLVLMKENQKVILEKIGEVYEDGVKIMKKNCLRNQARNLKMVELQE